MAKKVFISAGHGGIDSGAVSNGIKEKDLNLSIALACCSELERHSVNVKMSRTKDENDSLKDEIKECNSFNPDLAVTIHNNAGRGDGFEAYYHIGGGLSKTLAFNIEKEVKAIGQNSRGCKTKTQSDGRDWFGFIRETKPPAVLIECAFVDSKDVQIIDTEAERKKMGIAVAKGILKTLGIAWTPEKPKLEQFYIWCGHFIKKSQPEALRTLLKEFKNCYSEVRKESGKYILWIGKFNSLGDTGKIQAILKALGCYSEIRKA